MNEYGTEGEDSSLHCITFDTGEWKTAPIPSDTFAFAIPPNSVVADMTREPVMYRSDDRGQLTPVDARHVHFGHYAANPWHWRVLSTVVLVVLLVFAIRIRRLRRSLKGVGQ